MEGLPVELIEAIASCHVLTIEDVVNLTVTSKHLHEVMSNSAVVWKTKFLQRWPHFKGLFSFELYDWRNEVQYIYNLRKRTREILSTMSHRFYKRNELSDSDLSEWTLLASQHPRAYNYLADDLMNIINENLPINSLGVVPLITPGNKTMQYYAQKVLRHIRQERLSTDWVEYISLPEEMQILEKGAVFVAQWCQPHIEVNWEDVAVELDHIADKVKETLRHFNPKHPLFSVPEEERALWRARNLPSNKWKVTHCKQVITALGITLYQDLGFKGNDSAYYVAENSFINEVLNMKRGLPITLAIVYESVARRLGLKCEPVSFPAHFLLRFTEGTDGDTYYIDVFNNGDIIRRGSCPHSYSSPYNRGTSLYPTATAQQVVERMANNLEVSGRQHTLPNGRVTRLRSALELLQLVNPQDLSARVSLARLYMLHNMDTKPLIDLLLSQELGAPEQVQRIVHMLQDYEMYRQKNEEANDNKLHVVPRPSSVRFAVGMVMKHLALHYKCVIYDWDPCCLASDEWQAQMHVNRLTLKGEQPFYNVLVEDGSHRYVAQENLEPTADAGYLYLVEDIGRHFSHFYQTHYVPNAEKEKEFPTDTEVRHLFHYRMVGDDTKT